MAQIKTGQRQARQPKRIGRQNVETLASLSALQNRCEHIVQFYEDDAFLLDILAKFLTDAIFEGAGAIVIARNSHLSHLRRILFEAGVDLETKRNLTLLSAEDTLASFFIDGRISEELFHINLAQSLNRKAESQGLLRVFGEMVGLLAQRGHYEAAIRLEQLWSELQLATPFSLMCAYPMDCFANKESTEMFTRLCDAHSKVRPSERYRGGDESAEGSLRYVALLQQKAHALEAEIRHRTQMEQALRESYLASRRLAAIVESSDDAIVSKTLDGTITSWNAAAEGMFGYTPEEAIGMSVTMLIPDDALDEEPNIIRRIKRGYRIDHYDTVRKRKDGSLVEVSLSVSPLRDQDGQIVGASKILRDVSEKRRSERALRDAAGEIAAAKEELEKRVQDRTASLQDAVEQMEEFSYTLSHDLRAPLRAMKMYSTVLLSEYQEVLSGYPDAQLYLNRIEANAERLDKMIQDVLTFGRAARNSITLGAIDLGHFVREVIQYYPEMQAPFAEIIVDAPHSVIGHEASLLQVVSNLLGNAVKFVPAGTRPTVFVRSERIESEVRVWFEDNGIGIDPAYHHRLFNLFERIHPNLDYEGTGVGLAIVRKSIGRMGGRVGVESDGRSGSKFWIQLPSAGPEP